MKPPKMFIITCSIMFVSIFITLHIQHRTRMKILDINHKQTMLLTKQIEELKKDFQNDVSEEITKADLAVLAEINRFQSEKDKRYLDNKFELSKDYPMVFPDYVLVILILWLSFQLDNISRKIDKQSGPDKMNLKANS